MLNFPPMYIDPSGVNSIEYTVLFVPGMPTNATGDNSFDCEYRVGASRSVIICQSEIASTSVNVGPFVNGLFMKFSNTGYTYAFVTIFLLRMPTMLLHRICNRTSTRSLLSLM